MLLLLLATLIFTVSFASAASEVLAQNMVDPEPEYFMGMLILESQQQTILDSIRNVKELQLGNLVILHPMDQGWNLTLVEEAIRVADSLGIYTMFEPFNFSDHEIRISPEQFGSWKEQYPHLLGIILSEITGKQSDLGLWMDNSTGTISTRLQAEAAMVETLISRMQLAEYKENGAKILLQENVIGYAAANTSYCDVFLSKVFNAPNTEMMIGLARGMQKTYDIPAWGIFVDTWREWVLPPADFSASDVERALYEGWFYGAKYFFFEQGCFFGTLDRDWPHKYFILDEDGTLSDYGKVIQRFYAFLRNANKMGYEQPDYTASVAVMIGQSGWSSRGPDWGFWDQDERHGDLDYGLLNQFFPGVGDNWQIGGARTGKEFTGLPFGMVDIITVYAPPSVLKQYEVVIGLGWSLMTDKIAGNIEAYVQGGGVFLSFLTFTHSNEEVDDLINSSAWTESFASLFGVSVSTPAYSQGDVTADTFLNNIAFTEDTFWYPWSGKTYSYSDAGETDWWFWKFKYILSDSINTRVIAWVNGIQSDYNAFIVENKLGSGYTYMINTRNSNSLPNGAMKSDVLTDFIHALCTFYGRITVYAPYPETEYWLSQGQSDRTVYLLHDNSTATQNFTYYVRPMEADLSLDKKHIIFEYLNSEFYGVATENIVPLNVTLHQDEAKLFLLPEDDGTPQVLYSDALLTAAPIFTDHRLTVAIEGIEEAANTTKIFCSDFGRPRYILGAPFSLAQVYDGETRMLTLVSDSDITVGWNNVMDFSVLSSTTSLTDFSWNSTRGVLKLSAEGTAGQQGSIQVQMGETEPYYLKVDDKEISTWSYNESTGILSVNFSFTSETAEVVFGFKQIEVDQLFVSDARADVGSVQSVGFHLAWMSGGSDVAGATVEVNGTEYVTNQTGWISFKATCDCVGKLFWVITDVEFDGVTDYAKSVAGASIIWDRVNVTDSIVIDDVAQAGSPQTVWLKAEYEYDSVVFDGARGTVFLNGEPMTWSSQNLRWEYTATSNILGPQTYEVTAVNDESFGLTAVHNQNENIEIVWDEIEVTKTEFETNRLGVTTIRVHVAYSYTEGPVVNAEVSVNGRACNELGQGVYGCEIADWSPFQSFLVEVCYPDFEQATKTVSNIHASNTTLYVAVVLAVLLTVTFFVLRKRQRQQKPETASSDTPLNIRLLSVNFRKREWIW